MHLIISLYFDARQSRKGLYLRSLSDVAKQAKSVVGALLYCAGGHLFVVCREKKKKKKTKRLCRYVDLLQMINKCSKK